MSYRSLFVRLAVGLLLAVLTVGAAQAYRGDPPSRVGRLSHVRGDVSFAPAGEEDWVRAYINRPLIRGDRLWSDRRGRAEIQIGAAAFRIDQFTSFELLNLDDRIAQFELTQGTVNARVRRLYRDQEYEISTPLLALVITTPGAFRVDVDEQGTYVDVVVYDGEAMAYGDNARFPVRAGEAVRFYDARLRDYEVFDLPQEDEFDAFAFDRDRRFDSSVSLRYVSDDVIGYSDLDEYGSWAPVRDHGTVWFPRRVDAGWAPYRDGHWAWIEPWGWTWVDDAPWGFAPFHYGRWVHVTGRWGWVPSPRRERAVYAPALVGFIGGSGFGLSVSVGEPIGWFPLGPREAYIPPYYASRDYFTRVNVSNTVIQNNYITNVYNNYYTNDRGITGIEYMNRRVGNAVTVVPRDVFTSGRPVDRSLLRVDASQTARAEIRRMAAVAPTQRSLVGAAPVATARPGREAQARRVIARNQPGEVVAPFAVRQRELARTPGRPLTDEVERGLGRGAGRGRDAERATQVRVVGAQGQTTQRSAERIEDRPMPRGPGQGRGRARDELPGGPRGGAERVERGPPSADPRARESVPGLPADTPRGRGGEVTRDERDVEREQRRLERDAQRGEPRQVDRGQVEQQRQADVDRQREQQRAEREAQRAERQVERELATERERQVDVQRQQRDAERQQREGERQQRDVERQRFDADRQQREAEQQQRQAEQADRQRSREVEMQRQRGEGEQRRAEQAERQRVQQQREVEQQQRQAEQVDRQREQQQRQVEMQQRQAEQAERQREQQQQQAEQQQRQAEQMQQRQQEQQQRQMEQAQRQQEAQQRQAEQAERQQEAQQRQAEQAQRQQEQQQQQQQEKEKEEEGEDRGRGRGRGRDRDDGGWQP